MLKFYLIYNNNNNNNNNLTQTKTLYTFFFGDIKSYIYLPSFFPCTFPITKHLHLLVRKLNLKFKNTLIF